LVPGGGYRENCCKAEESIQRDGRISPRSAKKIVEEGIGVNSLMSEFIEENQNAGAFEEEEQAVWNMEITLYSSRRCSSGLWPILIVDIPSVAV